MDYTKGRQYTTYVIWTLMFIFLASDVESSVPPPVSTYTNGNWNSSTQQWTIPYIFSSDFFPINRLLSVLDLVTEIAASSCINLDRRLTIPTSGDYIVFQELFTPHPCEPPYFGRKNLGRNNITWGQCTELEVRRIILAHLGLYYEHQRNDRNDHVEFQPQGSTGLLFNIPYPAPQVFSTPYDFKSSMSVPELTGVKVFAKLPSNPSLPSIVLEENDVLSQLDEHELLKLYFHTDCPTQFPCSTSNTCQNGGTCFDRRFSRPFCACTEFFKGDDCEQRVLTCQSDTCKNSGVCVEEQNGQIKCNCVGLFAGNTCEDATLLPGWIDGGNGYQYKLTSSALNWYDANQQCKLEGADLAHDGIRDPPTFDFLRNQFTQHSGLWIGYSTHRTKMYFWNDQLNGRPKNVLSAPWASGQPTGEDSKHCAAIVNSLALENRNCNDNHFALCEKPIGNFLTQGVYKPGNGRMYFKTPAPSNFRILRAQCLERGGHLIVHGAATSAQLKDIVDNVFGSSTSNIYIGYEGYQSPNEFKPVVGTSTLLTNDPRWASGQPMTRQRKQKPVNAVILTVGMNGRLKNVNSRENLGYGLCETPEIPECTCDNGVCATTDFNGASVCKCLYGFKPTMDGSCTDVNECLAADNPCGSQTCVNTAGSYMCQ